MPKTYCTAGSQSRLGPLWDGPAVLRPHQQEKLARGAKDEERAMSAKLNIAIAVVGIDIGKNSFHVVGLDLMAQSSKPKSWDRHGLKP
jgi:hypothetical protein